MLLALTVQNLALLKRLETDLATGFTALTGETGAGKSLLLDALGLLLGARTDATLVRHGEPQAEVAGRFKPAPSAALTAWLEDNGLMLEEGELLVRRQIKREGGSKVWGNGTPITGAALAELGPCLGEIQGQHSAPDLLQPARQREVFDTATQLTAEVETVAQTYRTWQAAEATLQQATSQREAAERAAETTQHQLKLLDDLAYQTGEEITLSAQRAKASHGGAIRAAIQAADDALSAEKGALVATRVALKALKSATQYDETLQPLAEQLAAHLTGLEDISHNLARQMGEELELSLEHIDDRLHALKSVARTLGCSIEELPTQHEALQHAQQNLKPLQDAERAAALALTHAINAFHAACRMLTEARKAGATKLIPALTEALRKLLLPHAVVDIRLTPLPENQWGAKGSETLEILLASNPGSPLQPIQKVASGGELARLLLAIKQVLYATLPPQLLVLDEVDTGLSGAAASAVGAAMASLGARHQVLAVTHHAQVAAQATQHGTLRKHVEGGTTTTELVWLDARTRETELARLLAGSTLTPEAHAAAQALLREAKAA